MEEKKSVSCVMEQQTVKITTGRLELLSKQRLKLKGCYEEKICKLHEQIPTRQYTARKKNVNVHDGTRYKIINVDRNNWFEE